MSEQIPDAEFPDTLPTAEFEGEASNILVTQEQPGRDRESGILGEGGVGEVHRVRDQHLGRDVAYKILSSKARHMSSSDEARFLSEARITGQLEHPGIVPIYELGRREDGSLYYTMKIVRGRTLAKALQGRDLHRRLALLPAFIDCCQAIAYAHNKGFIHRDLKPANVMLGTFGETVVLDWGLAREISPKAQDSQSRTLAGVVLGTPGYMAPEQAQGRSAQADARADVYSLGAMLYELLAGARPYGKGPPLAILSRALMGPPQPPERLEPRCPLELSAVALRALSLKAEDRYSDAGALVADLQAFLTGGLVQAYIYSPIDRLKIWLKRRQKLLLMLLLCLLAGGGAWSLRSQIETQRIQRVERLRLKAVLGEVDALLRKAALGGAGPGWFDAVAIRLISMAEPQVAERMVQATRASDPMVRGLAIQALAGMSPDIARPPLIERLDPQLEPDFNLRVSASRSLGILGDPLAEEPLVKARIASGRHSPFWKAQTAYRMIPLPDPMPEMDSTAWIWRGRKFQDKRLWREADAAYSEVLKRDPKDLRALINRSSTRKRLGDLKGAVSDLDRAIQIAPENSKSYHNRGLLLRRTGSLQDSLRDFEIALEGKHRAVTLRARASTLAALGDLEAARADLLAATELSPKISSNQSLLAELALAEGRIEAAEFHYAQALQLNPDHSPSLIAQAQLQIYRETREEAGRNINRLMVLDPEELCSHSLNLEGLQGARYLEALKQARERVQPREQALALWAIYGPLQGEDPQAREHAFEELIAQATASQVDRWRLFALAAAQLTKASIPEALRQATGDDLRLAGLLRYAAGEEIPLDLEARSGYLLGDRCEHLLAKVLRLEAQGNRAEIAPLLKPTPWRLGAGDLSCAVMRWAHKQLLLDE